MKRNPEPRPGRLHRALRLVARIAVAATVTAAAACGGQVSDEAGVGEDWPEAAPAVHHRESKAAHARGGGES